MLCHNRDPLLPVMPELIGSINPLISTRAWEIYLILLHTLLEIQVLYAMVEIHTSMPEP